MTNSIHRLWSDQGAAWLARFSLEGINPVRFRRGSRANAMRSQIDNSAKATWLRTLRIITGGLQQDLDQGLN